MNTQSSPVHANACPANIPHIHADQLGRSSGEISTALLTGDKLPPRPFLLRVGDDSFKITDDNRNTIALGMLLAFVTRDELGR